MNLKHKGCSREQSVNGFARQMEFDKLNYGESSMKISLVALIASAFTGCANAQSTVTVFGIIDASITSVSQSSRDQRIVSPRGAAVVNQGSTKVSRRFLNSSAYNSSRLGFRGTEDLGGGLAASFWLEGALNNDDGTGAGAGGAIDFARRSFLSLSGSFGEVRLGRDYSPTFLNDSVFDPFGPNGVGTNLIFTANNLNAASGIGPFGGNTNSVRSSNSIGYFLPADLAGFYGQAMYSLHENNKYAPGTFTPPGVSAAGLVNPGVVATARSGGYVGGRFGYANGPLDIAVAYGRINAADNYYAGTTDIVKSMNLGASYDFSSAKIFGEISRVKNEREYRNPPLLKTPDANQNGYVLGVSIPVGSGLIRASYARVRSDLNAPVFSSANPQAMKVALGYVHHLSKRTALYATAARVNDRNGAALSVGGSGNPAFLKSSVLTPKTSIGYDLGFRHVF